MTIVNLLKEKSTRKKVFFTVFVLAVAMALTQIPVYGLNNEYMKSLFASTGVLSFMDSLSGGSLSNMSVSGFGITSYITASIVIQLMSVIFPKLEMIRKDGEQGRKRMEKIEFFLAMFITLTSGTLLAIGFGKQGLFVEYSAKYIILAIISWLIGSFIVITLGQKVEIQGIGNGITLILGFNILSRIPNNVITFYYNNIYQQSIGVASAYVGGVIIGLFLIFLITVYLQKGVLNIPIKQTRKKASIVNVDGNIPISVNIANVLPVIYASTLLSFPSIIITLFKIETNETVDEVLSVLSSSNWYNPTHWYHILGLILFILLIVGFGSFSSGLTFSPDEIADSMKKNGNVIPGINPGEDTIKFLETRRVKMSVINVGFLLIIAILPDFLCTKFGITTFSFLGTSLIIIISMLFDTALRLRAASIHNDKQFKLFG